MEGEGGSNIIQVTSQGRTYVMQLDPNGQPELTQVSEVTQVSWSFLLYISIHNFSKIS